MAKSTSATVAPNRLAIRSAEKPARESSATRSAKLGPLGSTGVEDRINRGPESVLPPSIGPVFSFPLPVGGGKTVLSGDPSGIEAEAAVDSVFGTGDVGEVIDGFKVSFRMTLGTELGVELEGELGLEDGVETERGGERAS